MCLNICLMYILKHALTAKQAVWQEQCNLTVPSEGSPKGWDWGRVGPWWCWYKRQPWVRPYHKVCKYAINKYSLLLF